jgi:ATP-dependent exoDNAse (exonuclease V) beta subunit
VRSATALAREATARATDPALAKDARDLELPPWNKGRYGTAVGRAVHAVLQTVDLVNGDDIDETAAAQAAAEGVVGREADIASLARSALASATVREAVTHEFRREMYVATSVDGHTLEGYVDLVYRTPEGLVVVDYKTDAWHDETDLDAKVARYRLQGASYALALEGATGETVSRCVFLFLGTDRSEERAVSDLLQAVEEVRALLAVSS